MMLRQRLLPAFHLMARTMFCIYSKHVVVAARITTTSPSHHGRLQTHQCGMVFPSRRFSSLTGSFQHFLPKSRYYSGITTTRYPPSQILYSHSTKQSNTIQPGPAIHRSQAPTHLDHIEDAINSTVLHYYQNQEQIISSNSPHHDAPESEQQDMQQQLNTLHQNILNFPPKDREMIGVSSNLQQRIRGLTNSGDCRRCWLQKRHCVCEYCVSLEGNEGSFNERGIPHVNRLFLLVSAH